MTTAAEIAARYGCTVAPGCVVQQIKAGVSGLPQYVWSDAKNQLVLDMTAEQRTAMAKAANDRVYAQARHRAAKAQAEANERVKGYHARGMTTAQMVEAGVSQKRVYDAYRTLGLTAHKVQTAGEIAARQRRADEAREFRAKIAGQIRECAEQGLSERETAARLSISRNMVERVRVEFGIVRAVIKKDGPSPKRAAEIAAREAMCAAIAADHQSGMTYEAICKKYDLTPNSLGMLNSRYGLGIPKRPRRSTPPKADDRKPSYWAEVRERRAKQRAEQQERHAKIRELRAGGMSVARIADELGIPFGTVRSFLGKNGIRADGAKSGRVKLDPRIHKHGAALEMVKAQEARRLQIIAMAEKGDLPTQAQMAAKFGVGAATINKDLIDLGISSAGCGPRGAHAMTGAILEMHRNGTPMAVICDTVGFSRSSVARVLQRNRDNVAAQ